MSTIGQRLRHARRFRGLTPEQLDEAAGLPLGDTARIASAARTNKRDAGALDKMAGALGVRGAWLQRGESVPGVEATAKNCLQTVPHTIGQVYGRPAVWLGAPEGFIERAVGLEHRRAETERILEQAPGASKMEPVACAAWLIPDPANVHDRFAVRVVIGESLVGHLARERAAPWQPILLALHRHHGHYVACEAEVYPDDDKYRGAVHRVDLIVPIMLGSIVVLDLGGV